MSLPLSPFLKTLPTYQPGRPIEEVARELGLPADSIIKVASNENPFGPSTLAMVALQKAFTSKQLGDAELIAKEAKSFAKWADKLAKDLQDSPVEEASTKKLIELLPTLFAKQTPDFDSARQIAWGYEVLSRDQGKPKEKDTATLTDLAKYLDLRLPKGRMGTEKVSPLEKELGERMKRLNDYDPGKFRELLGKLGKRD